MSGGGTGGRGFLAGLAARVEAAGPGALLPRLPGRFEAAAAQAPFAVSGDEAVSVMAAPPRNGAQEPDAPFPEPSAPEPVARDRHGPPAAPAEGATTGIAEPPRARRPVPAPPADRLDDDPCEPVAAPAAEAPSTPVGALPRPWAPRAVVRVDTQAAVAAPDPRPAGLGMPPATPALQSRGPEPMAPSQASKGHAAEPEPATAAPLPALAPAPRKERRDPASGPLAALPTRRPPPPFDPGFPPAAAPVPEPVVLRIEIGRIDVRAAAPAAAPRAPAPAASAQPSRLEAYLAGGERRRP